MKVGGLLARRRIGLLAAIVMPLALSGLSACSSAPKNDTFDLSASPAVETTASARNRQLLIADPSALKAVDSEQVLVRVSGSEIRYLSNAQWSDKLSRMVQSKLVEAFENTGKLGGVGKPGQGLAIDYQLITDIRAFEIDTSGSDRAVVEISAKLLNDRNGTVKAQRAFSASVPTGGSTNEVYIRAMDRAFGQVTAEIVAWTMTQL
ncbi:membrane integrity-associated transporter subunit PqiC [Rhizobium cremeum]|uniref:ABC-type transport auxiliary lipoprotein family protein n=1 Tax=Rhizobium cremeum TaxID=2813827 RepID=UPI001FD1804F|nr:ABC-type transport auxiliary lipoprotein family protein [Rhizobium cremeum]MCJ7993134.1 membrane integrity-associated transporter subunit PqiC [Rhizobium cremeum]MCJ7998199.1 membrane integrity-associated transporter subunit PqiC [Rhizobium cremeum]